MQLSEFLVKAKINGYAAKGEGGENILAQDGGKELVFNEGNFKYQDKYFGFNPFKGQEAVWQNNKAIWQMNYFGQTTSDKISPKEVYNFLKKCLQQVNQDKPFRGPDNFEQDEFKYINQAQGDINSFTGQEKILYQNHEVYKLDYHGGLIK